MNNIIEGRESFVSCSTWMLDSDTEQGKIYTKSAFKVGEFAKGKFEFTVTPESLYHLVEQGNLMLSRGIRIPIPMQHPIPGDTDDANKGWVIGFSTDGNELILKMEIIDEDPDDLVARYDVSVGISKSFTDGYKNKYDTVLTHCALTEYPLIPGLGKWHSIAASNIESYIPVANLELEEEQMELKELAAVLDIEGDATMELVLSAIETLKEQPEPAIAASGPPAVPTNEIPDPADHQPSASPTGWIFKTSEDEKVCTICAALDGKAFNPADMPPVHMNCRCHLVPDWDMTASNVPSEPDPRVAELITDNYNMKLDSLVKDSRINPAVRAKLGDLVKTEANTLSLSIKDTSSNVLASVIDILKDNEVLELGSKTGLQSAKILENELASPPENQFAKGLKKATKGN